jgi:hypothetical protein
MLALARLVVLGRVDAPQPDPRARHIDRVAVDDAGGSGQLGACRTGRRSVPASLMRVAARPIADAATTRRRISGTDNFVGAEKWGAVGRPV